MPSNNFTKININVDTYALLKNLAAVKGISAAALNELAILEYIKNHK